jgi:hypothetical protein
MIPSVCRCRGKASAFAALAGAIPQARSELVEGALNVGAVVIVTISLGSETGYSISGKIDYYLS